MSHMDLIPGLPDDVAFECLIRLPFHHLSTAASVSIGWKAKIEQPEFLRRRKATALTQSIIVMALRVDPTRSSMFMAVPVNCLVVYDVETGHLYRLPPVPGGLPLFCQLVGVGLDLVMMGGFDQVTWEISNSVFIYNFVLAKWRRGTNMPGVSRSFFGCASDCDRMVFVAGGQDNNKIALSSAIMYDVGKDKWVILPDMARERDECKVVFHAGKFCVIGGYETVRQDQFQKSAETFDVGTLQWGPVEEDFLQIVTCPRTCMTGGDGRLYMCRGGNLVTLDNAIWQVVTRLPVDVCNVLYLTSWHDKLLIIGSAKFGEQHRVYALDLKNCRWIKLEALEEYSGNDQSGTLGGGILWKR